MWQVMFDISFIFYNFLQRKYILTNGTYWENLQNGSIINKYTKALPLDTNNALISGFQTLIFAQMSM